MIVCSCFAVTGRLIDAAVEAGASDVDAVGAACRAGTGCGSCRDRIAERICAAGSGGCGDCARCSASLLERAS